MRSRPANPACEFALLSPGDPGVAEAVEALTRFQRARFDSPGARTSLSDEHFARFREEQATTDPRSRVARLTLDGEVVAASLHSVYRGRFHCFAPGFDNRFAKYSPGILLRGYVIRSCFENGWDPCDFGWGDEAYKYRWADCAEKLTTFVGTGVTGSLFAAGMGMRRSLVGALGKLRKRQPAG